jgi:hypothetical protein
MSGKKALQFTIGMLCLFFLVTIGSTQEEATAPPPIETMADMEDLFAFEPSYQEIQQVAMRYAEVHPDKIASWRSGASLRAFLPEVDFNYDMKEWTDKGDITQVRDWLDTSNSNSYGEAVSTAVSETREYGEVEGDGWSLKDKYSSDMESGWSQSAGNSETKIHDVITRNDNDYQDFKRWKIELSWDLRDFLYNKEQVKISKEARDLVELRQDVLEEVNTYFFDRRRAQIEMLFSPPSDVRSKIDLQLQIARVTASIDALTGGYLSNALAEAKTKR